MVTFNGTPVKPRLKGENDKTPPIKCEYWVSYGHSFPTFCSPKRCEFFWKYTIFRKFTLTHPIFILDMGFYGFFCFWSQLCSGTIKCCHRIGKTKIFGHLSQIWKGMAIAHSIFTLDGGSMVFSAFDLSFAVVPFEVGIWLETIDFLGI